jgi:hypothetical protein
MPDLLETLACKIPLDLHPICEASLQSYLQGQSSVHSPAYVCNMVDSSLIPLVECLLDTYADGVLLIPALL